MLTKNPLREKKLSLHKAKILFPILKNQGKQIVHCHGVFDLFHPGHLIHLQQAKKLGDILVISLTPDRFVNKGPSRPFFTEELRLEFLASLEIVDYVLLNKTPDAIYAIETIAPNYYVKGEEYKDHAKDITKKIEEEVKAVKRLKGEVVYTSGKTFSSSNLLNSFFSNYSNEQKAFLQAIKTRFSIDEITSKIEALSSLNVLVQADSYWQIDYVLKPRLSMNQSYESLSEKKSLQGAFYLGEYLSAFSNVTFEKNKKDLSQKKRFFLEKENMCLFETNHIASQKSFSIACLDRCDLILLYDFDMSFFNKLSIDHLSSVAFATENIARQKSLSVKSGFLKQDIQFCCLDNNNNKFFGSIIENKRVEIYANKSSFTFPSFENKLDLKSFFPFFSLCIRAGYPLQLCGFLGVIYSSIGKVVDKPTYLKFLLHLLK